MSFAVWQVPTKPIIPSPQQDRVRKYNEKLVGQHSNREITYQLLSHAKQTRFGEIDLIYCHLVVTE